MISPFPEKPGPGRPGFFDEDGAGSAFPPWAEERAVSDEALALAYESASPILRGELKKTVARLHALWGEHPFRSEEALFFRQGFSVTRASSAAPFALFLCPASYAHPVRFTAALMPAILAGVSLIVPVFVPPVPAPPASVSKDEASGVFPGGDLAFSTATSSYGFPPGEKPEPGLLAALELAGVERSFAMSGEDVLELLSDFGSRHGTGRVVLLGGGDASAFAWADALLARALRAGHGCAVLADASSLRLDAAHEGIWAWPDLEPCWFRARSLSFAAGFETDG